MLCFQDNGSRQKSLVCEAFDRLFGLLEERKCEMMVQINAEQQEKLDYIRGLRRRHSEHLETSAKLLETAIQTLDQAEMALFLQVSSHLLLRPSGNVGKPACSRNHHSGASPSHTRRLECLLRTEDAPRTF